ncbi:MAG: aminotransferase class V-fold PLP-dependent enzyme, partial [Thermomicrobiales bacterium]
LPLREVAEIAHAKGVSVIVDAAAELPPRSNLRRFIADGADLVAYSGGKAIGGPQASGVLAGRRDLIDSVALQHQDMDVRAETWSKRHYIDEGRVRGVPTQGFGRGLKVGREEIVGLITALKIFAAGKDEDDWKRWDRVLDIVHEQLDGIPGLTIHRTSAPPARYPAIWAEIDEERTGIGSYALINALLAGDPPIAAAESLADKHQVGVLPHGLTEEEADIVGRRIRALTLNR